MKRTDIIICVVIIGFAMIALSTAGSNTITVKQDGSGDYVTIQEAVDNANQGDNILIYTGTYTESVVVSGVVHANDLRIKGMGHVVIEGDGIIGGDIGIYHLLGHSGLEIIHIDFVMCSKGYSGFSVSRVRFDDCMFDSCIDSGISCGGVQGFGIRDSVVKGCGNGILLATVDGDADLYDEIFRCSIRDNFGFGVSMSNSQFMMIDQSNIEANVDIGVNIGSGCFGSYVRYNNIHQNAGGEFGQQGSDNSGITWDMNFYSGYIGEDADGDGYGDTPHYLPPLGIDLHPKMTYYRYSY